MTYDYSLNLDVSTKCTGYSIFDTKAQTLLSYGIMKPKLKGVSTLKYPLRQLRTMQAMSEEIMEFIRQQPHLPKVIVIEEIAGSKNRLSQKTLDGQHWILLQALNDYALIERVVYYDVTGVDGWRTHLNLRMDAADKLQNKEAKVLNKKIKGTQQMPTVNTKTLSCRHANRVFGLNLDADVDTYDADRADAICMGHAYLSVVCK